MAAGGADRLRVRQIPPADLTVLFPGDEALAVRRDPQRQDATPAAGKGALCLRRPGVPQPYRVVHTAREHAVTLRREGDSIERIGVAGERRDRLARRDVP